MWIKIRKKLILRRGRIRRQKAWLHFPPGCTAIKRLLEEGDYEPELAGEILRCLPPKKQCGYLDVGAYIGLLSLPVLRYREAKVFSVEGSEEACRLMKKTLGNSPYRDRWVIQPAVISRQEGTATFHQHTGADAVYSGLQPTGRSASGARAKIVITRTLDSLWKDWGQPAIQVVKIDLEGGELAALEGASQLLAQCRPVVFLEWERTNIQSHGLQDADLIRWAEGNGYEVFRIPDDVPVTTPAAMRLAMERTENFRLEPTIYR